jgi:hypothetical protein
VSLLSRNRSDDQPTGVRGQALYVARQAVPLAMTVAPLANQAIPVARNAGASMRGSANGAVEWATPRVNNLRLWAAPQLQQGGMAIMDTIAPRISSAITGTIAPRISEAVTGIVAPRISDALLSTAQLVDVTEVKPRRKRWPGVLAVGMLLAAAATAATAISRNRQAAAPAGYTPSSSPIGDPSGSLTDITEHRDGDGSVPADGDEDDSF